MENQESPISDMVDKLDLLSKPFAEHKLNKAINSHINEQEGKEISLQWKAEAMAFGFVPKYQNKETGWGTYYGPMWVLSNGDGTATESPSIKLVTPEMLSYWEERSRNASHPILKLRYADLVWDFSNVISGRQPNYLLAHTIIDDTIEIAEKNLHELVTDVISKLERALSVAVSINDQNRIEKLKNTIIKYEDKVAVDNVPRSWGFSFDLLLKNKKIPIAEGFLEKIIKDLEDRLAKLSGTTNPDPWAAEAAALRLAAFYQSKNHKEKIHKALLKFGTAFAKASENAAAIQASGWLQHVYSIYLKYGMRDEAEKISVKLKEIGPKTNQEMHEVSHSMEVSKEEIDAYVKSVIDNDLETSYAKIAIQYIPRKDQVENQLKDLAQKAPLQFLITRQLQDHRGRPVAVIGSLEEDLLGNIVHLASQNISFSIGFLRRVVEAFIAKFELTSDKIIDYLYESPAFEDEKKLIIHEGIKSYLENNHLVAIHLLVPQIESAIRNLIELSGGSVLKPSRTGGMHLKTLDELLRDERLINIFGDNIPLYFRILLTDQRGWNIRNDVCHGISPAPAFQVSISDRVFHALLCLALVRETKNNKKAEQSFQPDREPGPVNNLQRLGAAG